MSVTTEENYITAVQERNYYKNEYRKCNKLNNRLKSDL